MRESSKWPSRELRERKRSKQPSWELRERERESKRERERGRVLSGLGRELREREF